MRNPTFTGERLHPGSDLFAVDLVRHSAAYRFAMGLARDKRVLDLGSGSGYGTAELASVSPFVVGVDRIAPDPSARSGPVRYVRADLAHLPLLPASFDLVVSLQVIEHLEDPTEYLAGIAGLLRPGGAAVLTTPNRLTSDGENPYHVHEYVAEELERLLRRHFMEVDIKGVGATPAVARYLEARLRRIRLLTSLDPLGLRRALPRPLLEWLFARLAVVLRRSIRRREGLPEVTWKDFPIGGSEPTCLDILAVCRRPTREVR
jgi:SAM-dependent methyltransferase